MKDLCHYCSISREPTKPQFAHLQGARGRSINFPSESRDFKYRRVAMGGVLSESRGMAAQISNGWVLASTALFPRPLGLFFSPKPLPLRPRQARPGETELNST